MTDTPKSGTAEWDALLHGVLFANTADRKGWVAQLTEAGNDQGKRRRVIEEIKRNGGNGGN